MPHLSNRPVAVLLLAGLVFLLSFAACRVSRIGGADFGVQHVAFESEYTGTGYVPTLDGPLRIITATPHGITRTMSATQPVTVTFSRPMVSLGEVPDPDPSWLTIEPSIRGSLEWNGTQTLVFMPDAPWPNATSYTVRLASGIESVDGERLAEGLTWQFDTPRPQVRTSSPAAGEQFADANQPLIVHFNQAISTHRAGNFISLREAEGNRDVRISVRAHGDSSVTVVPTNGLDRGTAYVLNVGPGVPAAIGPLPMTDTTRIAFSTYGDLELVEIDHPTPAWARDNNPAFEPTRGIRFTFTNPVNFGDLRRAIQTMPESDFPPGIEIRDGATSTTHVVPLHLEPEANYTLTISNLTDAFGQTLTSASRSFRTRALTPSLSMPQGVLVVEADETPALPIRATNMPTARYDMRAIGIDDVIRRVRTYDRNHWYGSEDQPPAPAAANNQLDITLPRNRPGVVPLDMGSHLNANGTGIVLVRLHRQNIQHEHDDFRVIAQVTRLNISAKFSAHQNLIFVTELSSGNPVGGATVTIRDLNNREHWRGQTDRSGRVETPGWHELGIEHHQRWSEPVQFVFVERGDDVAFSSSIYNDGIEPYRFGLNYEWNPQPVRNAGSVFSDRGLYMAGETVHLKGILRTRTDGDWESLQGDARVVIRSPRDEVVLDRIVNLSDMGSFDFDWESPQEAAQGQYLIRVAATTDTTITDSWSSTSWAEGNFRIDSFRRATFEVTSRAATSEYVVGDYFEGTVSARYLFGAAMGPQPVRVRLLQSNTQFSPPGYPAFRFGAFSSGYHYETLISADTVLTNDGTLDRRLRLRGTDNGTPLQLSWEATVTDPARQEQTGMQRIVLHPGLFYIGLRPRSTYLNVGSSSLMEIDVITVDPAGAPVGDRNVTVELVRRQWNSVREVGTDGRLRWRSEAIEEVMGKQEVTSIRGRMARISMPVTEGGSYVVRATSEDVRGNTIRSEAYFWAAGSSYVAWERADDERIDLIPEKTNYAPGETARIMIQSPFEQAKALVTVEREGILSSRVIDVQGSSPQIEIPITEDHLPNVFVSVILLHGRSAAPNGDADPGAPAFRVGYTELRVDPGERRLNVEVTPSAEILRPGDKVTVNLRLTDHRGRGVPGEITFSAADLGVLNLINYRLPDPFDAFYGPRPLAVSSSVMLANLIRQRDYGQKEEDMGGGGGDRSDMLRRDFRAQAHWEPSIQTDRSGRARITFTVPESMTTFRLMATGHTANHRFGTGSADVQIQQPLVLQPALPRFARPGDTFEAGVLITNLTGRPGEATVHAEAVGDGISLTGSAERRVRLEAGETREVRFNWVSNSSSEPELRFRATLGSERDAFATHLTIQAPTVRIRTGTFASTENQATEAIHIPADAVAGLGGFRVTMASTALTGLDGAARYLFEYPYGCIEQRTSRIRPLVLGNELLDMYDLTVLDGDRDQLIRQWLSDIEGFWTGNGFSMWRGQSFANVYASAYVLLVMAEARDAGYDIPQHLTQQAVSWLDRAVRNRSQRPQYYTAQVWEETRALMLYVLARHGRVLESEINTLIQERAALSTEALSHLARITALPNASSLTRHQAALIDQIRSNIQVEATGAYVMIPNDNSWRWIFASNNRATASALVALSEVAPNEDNRILAERMVRYLMRNQTGFSWASTQENATVIDGFRAFVAAYERETPDMVGEITLAGQQILRESFRGRSLNTAEAERSLDALQSGQQLPVTISAEGQGRIYYTLALDTYSNEPRPAFAQGLTVSRTIQPIDDRGEPIGPPLAANGELPAGQLVRVTIRLSSGSVRNYVVVDDALPAGMEALNAAFETTSSIADQEGSDRWWGSFNHFEIHDDRVVLFADYLTSGEHVYTYLARATTPGTFVHPPIAAEEMYNPEVMGRSAGGTLVVVPGP